MNTTAARYQNLSINQSKLSGQCGRLKCCLNYELDTYLDALQFFPENCDTIQVAKGTAILIKKDIFKSLMWYILPDSNKQYPVTIERVKKIKSLNHQGVIPEELEHVDVTSNKPKEVEPEFVDVVGQISLRSLEKADKKRHHQQRGQQQNQQRDNRNRDQQRPQQQNRQQGQGGNQQGTNQQGGNRQGQQRNQQQNPQNQQRPNQQRPPFKKRDK